MTKTYTAFNEENTIGIELMVDVLSNEEPTPCRIISNFLYGGFTFASKDGLLVGRVVHNGDLDDTGNPLFDVYAVDFVHNRVEERISLLLKLTDGSTIGWVPNDAENEFVYGYFK